MRRRHALALLLPVLALPAPAALGAEDSGGVSPQAGSPAFLTASDGAVSLRSRPAALVGVRKAFTGTVPAADAGRTVTIERFDELAGGWNPIARATVADDGDFRARWRPDKRVGTQRVRARVTSTGASAASAAPEIAIRQYRNSKATWYGPGFYGRRTACGQRMSKTLVGVAHKTLKCGTDVEFAYKGRVVTAPVVDRGPFANGAHYDLTSAAAERLGVASTVRLGAVLADVD